MKLCFSHHLLCLLFNVTTTTHHFSQYVQKYTTDPLSLNPDLECICD